MSNVIEIKNRSNEEIECWKVDVKLTPNTVIETDGKVTVLVKVDGEKRVSMKPSTTVYGLFNPGKTNKMFGGNKEYEKSEMYVVDQSSNYVAEWALVEPNALVTIDPDFDVEAKVFATGTYCYKIDNFFAFVSALPFDENGEVSRDAVREYLRKENVGVIKKVLGPILMRSNLNDCLASIDMHIETIKEEINKQMIAKGIEVSSFTVNQIKYTKEHEKYREELKKAKVDNVIGAVKNDGRRDDISVDKEQALVDNIRRSGVVKEGDKPKEKEEEKAWIVCPRCGEKNQGVNYCGKCGEKLTK